MSSESSLMQRQQTHLCSPGELFLIVSDTAGGVLGQVHDDVDVVGFVFVRTFLLGYLA